MWRIGKGIARSVAEDSRLSDFRRIFCLRAGCMRSAYNRQTAAGSRPCPTPTGMLMKQRNTILLISLGLARRLAGARPAGRFCAAERGGRNCAAAPAAMVARLRPEDMPVPIQAQGDGVRQWACAGRWSRILNKHPGAVRGRVRLPMPAHLPARYLVRTKRRGHPQRWALRQVRLQVRPQVRI